MFARGLTAGHSRTRPRREGGAVAVEFALVLPVLATLMFGIITFGFAYNSQLGLTNTVREGSRFGASTDNTSAWADAVVTRTKDLYFNSDAPLTDAQTCALLISSVGGVETVQQSSSAGCVAGSSDAGPVPDSPAGVSDDTCIVKVWAQKPASLNWLVVSTVVTLRAESVSFYNRDLACP